jgi:hypothetical protein
MERYDIKTAYIAEYKPDDSLHLYIEEKTVPESGEFNLLAGKESISDMLYNFSNKNIVLIILFLREQIESQDYTDLSMKD